ncbi:MAG TPA: hypothetical protein VNM87_10185 [Candidatus Udaeobacter sp.]|nr:hypothetical protein [Candidatus Udaeobacter sp.]
MSQARTAAGNLLLFDDREGQRAARPAAAGGLAITAPLERHRRGAEVMSKVRYVRRFFPELEDLALKVGLTRSAAGFAELEGDRLWLNPNRLSLHTIAHELTHLLQGRGLVPRGERSCDLFALARDLTLVDSIPYYLRVPAKLADARGWLKPGAAAALHELAVAATVRRAGGERRYLRWFEQAAAELP